MAALTEAERGRLAAMEQWQQRSGAYLQVQGTRPQTIGQSLVDSPSGLLAWIVEKFQDWTDPDAKLPEDAVDRDRILTDVSIYWFTATAGVGRPHLLRAVQRPRHVGAQGALCRTDRRGGLPHRHIHPPCSPARPDNIVRWSEFDRGGHFAALEAPDLLTADIREFFRTLTG